MCWCTCSPWCLRYLLSSDTRSCFCLVESSHRFRHLRAYRDRISKGGKKRKPSKIECKKKEKAKRVYSISVGNPLGNDLPKCLLYPPRLAVPEGFIDVVLLQLTEMRHTLHSSCKETISATPQEAELSQTSSQRLEKTCTASCTLKSIL